MYILSASLYFSFAKIITSCAIFKGDLNIYSFINNKYEEKIIHKKIIRGNKSHTIKSLLDNYFELKNKEKFIKIIINIIFINNVFYIIKYIYNIIIVFFLFTSTLVLNNSFEYFFSSLFHFLFKSFLSKCSKLFSLSLYSISDSSFISLDFFLLLPIYFF